MPFASEKIGNSFWKVRVSELPRGKYGFLAPGILSVSISASGKMYTFGVTGDNTPPKYRGHAQNGQNDILQSTPAEQVFSAATIGVSAEGNPSVRHDGVTLSWVAPDGPADRAGIKAGDVILALADHYLFTIEELNREILRYKPGTQVAVRYRRRSTIYDTNLMVGVAD